MTDAAAALAALAAEYWERVLADHPVFATSLGDRRYDDRLGDITPEGRARMISARDAFRSRAGQIPGDKLSDADRITLSALLTELDSDLALLRAGLEEWTVDPLRGPQVSFQNIESFQPIRTVEEGRAMVRRWEAMGPSVDDHVANLRLGLAAGKVAVRAGVEKAVGGLGDQLAKPDGDWALLRPAAAPHEDWSTADLEDFRDGLRDGVASVIRPALERYLAFLRSDILPSARPQERPGILHVPGGAGTYADLIRVYTGLTLDPKEVHETGLQDVARINGEFGDLGKRVFGTGDRPAVLERLRTDPALYFRTGDEVAAKAASALARAKAAIPEWFGRLPKADCEVVRMGEHEEKHSTIAYYRQPAADGSRPGRYYINTSEPETRPRYEAETLAYHEAIPGHHLQLAIMQELEGLPAFRRHGGVTAFVEGWALYTERLADEMGLYTSDVERFGILSYDAWRACRLVVDTGMHAFGWTRQRAIDFMWENTALAMNNIVNEVDRYIAWPGQALAYKVGQMEIWRLRREAEERLGARFDIRAFHDAVLENGAVSLPTLRNAAERFVTRAS